MEVYIDKENLKSFIKARNNLAYKDSYEDCCRMLKRQLHINYNFEKTRDLIEDNSPFRDYFRSIDIDGFGNDENVDSYKDIEFPSRPIKSNVANSFNKNQYSSIFLIDDEKINLLIDKGTFIVGTPGKEVESLNKLFCGKDYDFHKLYDIQSKDSFPNWEQLSKDGLNLPLTDIIVMDRYIGGQIPRVQSPENSQIQLDRCIGEQIPAPADYNINKLLEVLVERVKAEVNIVFFCNQTYSNMKITPDWEQFRKDVKSKVKNKTGVNCNVTIVFYPQKAAPHDRMIFTNYMLYRSGDSFEYFNSKGEIISQGKSLDVDSLAKKDNYDFAMSIIDDMQGLYEGIYGKNPDMVIGDKKSNYIKFTK